MKKFNLLGFVALCAALLIASASADLLVYEGFDMNLAQNAQITGQAGATSFGWAEPFRMNSSAGAAESARFVPASLTGLLRTPMTHGGAVTQTVNNSRFYRNFSQVIGSVDGTYYLSFMMSSGQNIALDLSNGDWNSNVKATIGIADTQTGSVLLKVGSTSSAALAPRNEVHFYVVKMVLTSGTDTISIYVDPDIYAAEPAAPKASINTTGFAIDRIRFGKYNSNTYSLFDEFRLGQTWEDVTPGNGAARIVSPLSGQINVPLTQSLQWQVGNDPNDFNGVQPWTAVQGYYVYFGTDAAQLVLQTPQAQTATSFAPSLANDNIYYWQIVEALDNEQGGLYGPSDPNNVFGPVWSFQTPLSVPVIMQQPAALTRASAGSTVEITVGVDSVSPPFFNWYYSADAVVGGDSAVGVNSATLTLSNVQLANEGYYYCVIGNNSGQTATSAMAQLVLNRLLAHYQFENNLDDTVGSNDAVPAGSPMTYTTGVVTADGQTYAADPNGGMYGMLPTGCYPKTGPGNGLDRFTYSAWVKVADSTGGGQLMGDFNSASNGTAMRLSINVSGFDLSFYLRQEGGSAVIADIPGLSVTDNQWHFVTVTYDGSNCAAYLDGRNVKNAGPSLSNFAAWEYPLPILAINSRGTLGGAFKGGVDDFRIHNYALTREEIAQTFYDVTGEKACMYGNPARDLSGNCVVDLADFALIAEDWLVDGFYPLD